MVGQRERKRKKKSAREKDIEQSKRKKYTSKRNTSNEDALSIYRWFENNPTSSKRGCTCDVAFGANAGFGVVIVAAVGIGIGIGLDAGVGVGMDIGIDIGINEGLVIGAVCRCFGIGANVIVGSSGDFIVATGVVVVRHDGVFSADDVVRFNGAVLLGSIPGITGLTNEAA